MIIGNANVWLDGKFQPASVTVEGDKIVSVGEANIPCDVDAAGKYLVPGFVDVHTHGAMNEDFSDGKSEGLQKMSRYYAQNGVTSFLATTMTLKEETLLPAMEAIRSFTRPADGPNAPVFIWRVPSFPMPSGEPRRPRIFMRRMRQCFTG